MDLISRDGRPSATDKSNPRKTIRLRERSLDLVLSAISRSGPISSAELSTTTGLSRATVASVISELVDQGRVVGALESAGRRGRPPQMLSVAPEHGLVAAVDFGHSHVGVAVADSAGNVLAEHNEQLDVDASARTALNVAASTLRGLIDAAPALNRALEVVVMGVPGPIDTSSGRLRSGTLLPGWTGLQPARELTALIGYPVVAENDANLGALGEQAHGAGRGSRNFLYVKAATGIGAGVVLNGELYRGIRGTAGEIGHVQIQEDGALCRCGSRGCLETLASAGFAAGMLNKAASLSQSAGLPAAAGRTLDPGSLAVSTVTDAGAYRVFNDMGLAIGRVVADVSSSVDPEFIVVGGQLVDDGGALLAGITSAVNRFTQPYVSSQLSVVRGVLGPRAALVGAISMATALSSHIGSSHRRIFPTI